MTTKRQAFNALTKRTLLIDAHNMPIVCTFPGCKCHATDLHHIVEVCKGGTNAHSNLKPFCKKHHIQHHSTKGDFREWGRKGGKASAATGAWKKNLKQYRTMEVQV